MNALRRALPLLLGLTLAAAARAQDPVRFHGVEFDLPSGWSTEANDEGVFLIKPAGWKQGELTGEAYGLLFDEETKSLDADGLDETIDGAADAIVSGLTRTTAPASGKLGALEGKTYRYSAQNGEGKKVSMTIHVVAGKDGCVAMFVLGLDEKLATREKEIATLVDSLRLEGQKKQKRAFGLGKKLAEAAERQGQPAGENGDTSAPDAPPAEKPKFTPIPDAQQLNWNGVTIDVPKEWRTQAGDEGTQMLVPPGFGESGIVDELFALCGDGSVASLDAHDLAARLQDALDQIQPGLSPQGEAKAMKFGALAGKRFVFAGATPDGQRIEAHAYAFPTQGGVRGLLALGFPAKLQTRQRTVDAMLGSLRPQAGAAKGQGNVPQELAGQWSFYAQVDANNGGGSQRQKVLTLGADGAFLFRAGSVSTNPNGAAWGDQNDQGTWTADATSITFRSQSGAVKTFTLEKRNHPKNRDPMLVIGGDAFVTVTQRAPW